MTLDELSWKVTEEEYRKDPALSYSTLSKFEREGYAGLSTLFDRVETPSLIFGSAVDAVITGSWNEFEEKFTVGDFSVSDTIKSIIDAVYNTYGNEYNSMKDIPYDVLSKIVDTFSWYGNWSLLKRVSKVIDEGSAYYLLCKKAEGKTLITEEMYQDVQNCVRALRFSPAGKYIYPDAPLKAYYQLKFKSTLSGIDYRCMADVLIQDDVNKVIYPVDLKTTGHPEYEFYKSFLTWNYQIQARLYYRIIRDNMDRCPEFADYKLADYNFIVVNKSTLRPLIWNFNNTKALGKIVYDLEDGTKISLRDPETIGKELSYYLNNQGALPLGIKYDEPNNIAAWIKM